MDAVAIARIVDAQFPELSPASVAYLGEGYDSAAYEVNAKWVFRFPKRDDVEQQLLVESRILPLLVSGTPIPVPRFRFQGRPSAAFPRRFAGYQKLPGTPALQLEPDQVPLDRVAPAIGRFLAWLHRFPSAEATRAGVPSVSIQATIEEVRADAVGSFESVASVARSTALDRWYSYLHSDAVTGHPQAPPVLVHNDLAAEHVLFDPVSQSVSGIIDWSDVAVSDPAADLAGIYHWGGDGMMAAVLAAYDAPVAAGVLARARFLGACRGAADVTFGLETGRREYIVAGLRALALCAGASSA
jgi:aminoglycoside phosphotransferase (APT) family kinase protein